MPGAGSFLVVVIEGDGDVRPVAGPQHGAGDGARGGVARIVQVPGTVALADADDDNDENGGRGTGQERGDQENEAEGSHSPALPPSRCREIPVNEITSFPLPGNLLK